MWGGEGERTALIGVINVCALNVGEMTPVGTWNHGGGGGGSRNTQDENYPGG